MYPRRLGPDDECGSMGMLIDPGGPMLHISRAKLPDSQRAEAPCVDNAMLQFDCGTYLASKLTSGSIGCMYRVESAVAVTPLLSSKRRSPNSRSLPSVTSLPEVPSLCEPSLTAAL